jgi:hypothetical protein
LWEVLYIGMGWENIWKGILWRPCVEHQTHELGLYFVGIR